MNVGLLPRQAAEEHAARRARWAAMAIRILSGSLREWVKHPLDPGDEMDIEEGERHAAMYLARRGMHG